MVDAHRSLTHLCERPNKPKLTNNTLYGRLIQAVSMLEDDEAEFTCKPQYPCEF